MEPKGRSHMQGFWALRQLLVNRLLIAPALIDDPTPVHLPLLQHHLSLPLVPINRIDIPTGLNAEARSGTSGRGAPDGLNMDVFASVELEGGLGAVDFEMDLAFGMVGCGEPREGR